MALSLSRRPGEEVVVHDRGRVIGRILVTDCNRGKAMLRFEGFAGVGIDRREVYDRLRAQAPAGGAGEGQS